jgi:hypothetical protein
MKHPLRCAVTLVTLFLAAAGAVTAAPPQGWRQNGSVAMPEAVGRDMQIRRGGQAGGFIHLKDTNLTRDVGLAQEFRADNYRGKRLRVSAYIKTEGVGDDAKAGVSLGVQVHAIPKRLAFAFMSSDHTIHGTTDWKRYEQVIEVPTGAAYISISVLLFGPGQVWVDDFQVETVGSDVATTSRPDTGADAPLNAQERRRTLAAGLPTQPVNLDFEH